MSPGVHSSWPSSVEGGPWKRRKCIVRSYSLRPSQYIATVHWLGLNLRRLTILGGQGRVWIVCAVVRVGLLNHVYMMRSGRILLGRRRRGALKLGDMRFYDLFLPFL